MSTKPPDEYLPGDGGVHVPVLCDSCTRRLDPEGYTCTSFPDGIPDDIAIFGGDHRRPIADELPFELDPAKQSEFTEWLGYMGQEAP